MAGSVFRVSIDAGRLAPVLANLHRATGDLEPVFAEVGEYLVSATVQRFLDSVDPDGQAWTPLSTSAAKARAGKSGSAAARGKRMAGAKPLVLRGHLRDSVTYAAHADGLEVGTNLIYAAIHQFYAAIHQFGGVAGRGHRSVIPARPYLGISGEDLGEIAQLVTDHLAEWVQ